jgi:hypothetical protein
MKRPNVKAFKKYNPKLFTLIPLHKPAATRVINKKGEEVTVKIGKRPRDNAWTTLDYDTAKVVADAEKSGRNVGVRLTQRQLVVDVDPRNYAADDEFESIDSYEQLIQDIGFDPKDFPCVTTGSGGLHIYMTLPEDTLVVDTVNGYPGIEFKSKGRQVLAAGCIHPETGREYVFTEGHPGINVQVPCPKKLLRIIKREPRPASSGGGHITQERLAKALAGLDPCNFADNTSWLKIMMACHHATGGDGRSEFIEWSTQDPKYADDAEIIGRRWDSLHADKGDGVTVATLNEALREAGRPDLSLPLRAAKNDFSTSEFMAPDEDSFEEGAESDDTASAPDPDSEFEFDELEQEPDANSDGIYSGEDLSLLEQLSREYSMVVDGGRVGILYQMPDEDLGRSTWQRLSREDFAALYNNKRITRDTEELGLSRNAAPTIELGTAWLKWPSRTTYRAVCFDPSEERTVVNAYKKKGHNVLNLWTGWGLQPSKKGSWLYLQEMMYEALCGGNDEYFDYLMNWLRYAIQHPERQGEVAVVMRGEKGIGKSTLGSVMCRMIGRHAMHVASAQSLTGRFNAHMQDCLFLFSDEAVKPNDKNAESVLKHIITSETIEVEKKGVDLVTTRNRLKIMMASNAAWVIPASMDERRYFVLDVLAKYQGNADFWRKLYAELGVTDGSFEGLSRMLFDLGNADLPESWRPGAHLPITEALQRQKEDSLDVMGQWIYNQLHEGMYEFPVIRESEGRVRVFAQDIREKFSEHCKFKGVNPGSFGRGGPQLFEQLRDALPSTRLQLRDRPDPENDHHAGIATQGDGRAWSVDLPDINHARKEFDAKMRKAVAWPHIPGLGSDGENEFEGEDDFG